MTFDLLSFNFVSGPARISASHYLTELYRMAAVAAEQGNWISAHIAYREITEIQRDAQSTVMLHETKRLLGLDVAPVENVRTLLIDIETILGASGEHLASSLVQRTIELLEISDIPSLFLQLPTFQRSLAQYLLSLKRWDDIASLDMYSVLPAVRIQGSELEVHREVFSSYSARVPFISTVRNTQLREGPETFEIDAAQIIRIESASVMSGSEIILKDNRVFGDSLLRPEASHASTRGDTAVYAVDQNNVIVHAKMFSLPRISMDDVVFMAYAGTESWGHWFNEVLVRLAVFAAPNEHANVKVIVRAEVPTAFIDMASRLFPEFEFIRVPDDVLIECKQLWVIPTRISRPTFEDWSLDGDLRRLHSEPESVALLAERMRRLVSIKGSRNLKLFLSRRSALYRQSSVDSLLASKFEASGYTTVDLGALPIDEQIALSIQSKNLAGICGSNWEIPVACAENSVSGTIIHHDRPFEWRGLAWSFQEFSGQPLNFILGERAFRSLGYSQQSYHTAINLSAENLLEIEELM